MGYGLECRDIRGLIKRENVLRNIQEVADPAIGELIPQYGKFSEDRFQLTEEPFDARLRSCHLEVIYMFGYHQHSGAVFM